MKRGMYILLNLLLAASMLVSAALCVFAISTTDAVNDVNTDAICSLSVSYTTGEMAFENQTVRLYHIADIKADLSYELSGGFACYPVSISGTKSKAEWKEMTSTLSSYILADGIKADTERLTDEGGNVSFTGLVPGMYLVGSVRVESDGKAYLFDAFMAAVPGLDENGIWVYDVSAKPKMAELEPPSDNDIEYIVIKTWKDEGNREKRPSEVTVEIFKNGISAESVILNSANNWMYSFKAADDGGVWSVAERNVPEGYRVGIQQNGNTFCVTNAYLSDDRAPQTGDNFDILPYLIIMLVSGILLIILGIAGRKKRYEE